MRKPMVTRVFTMTKCIVLCMDTNTCEACNEVVTLEGTYPTETRLMNAVRKEVEHDTIKAVEVVSKEVIEELRGMTTKDFLKNSIPLDAKTRKPLDD